ncbi:interferon-induced protein with tetratricopeptide repeats 3-like [Phascolarctos cinereus]|uniref:Interferon-induced protein with tetratricopeptide repeats 3-like n=1 Tax=Phascolarctos cinereus TaxID=38626 RepID=A0A6P5J774_PHACI|nr:interferon-induced protein with tetratricopeptide repeats 3-like [Phascolarctos cinereus]
MSEVTRESLEAALKQLSCHFTWHLFKDESNIENLEEKIVDGIGFLCPQSKASGHNLLAYLKHLQGRNEEALSCLQRAEELTQQEHPGQAEVRNLVTWGNYAWLYYHMGRLEEARTYLDKVAQTCRKFANPYRIDCPEMDCEEGWARLKCGNRYAERSKACFERALEKEPLCLELRVGLAIATCGQVEVGRSWRHQPLDLLRQTLELDPDNNYLKVLLALKLQKMNDNATGEKLVEEALEEAQSPEVFRLAAKFYRSQGFLEKALSLFEKALEFQPATSSLYHQIGCCYRTLASQILHRDKMEGLQDRGTREKVRQLHSRAAEYMEKALEKSGCYPNMYLDLASMYAALGHHKKAEAIYQKALLMEPLTAKEKQQIHQRYGNFQDYFRGQTDTAIYHYLEGMKIQEKSAEYEKMKARLQELADQQRSQKPPTLQGWRLLGFSAKMEGNESLAIEYYEKALGILLKPSSSGVASLFTSPSSPEAERDEGPGRVLFQGPGNRATSVLNGENKTRQERQELPLKMNGCSGRASPLFLGPQSRAAFACSCNEKV